MSSTPLGSFGCPICYALVENTLEDSKHDMWKCLTCDVIFQNKRVLNLDFYADAYSHGGNDVMESFRSALDRTRMAVRENLNEILLTSAHLKAFKLLRKAQVKRVMDIGSGPCNFAIQAKRKGFEIFASDVAESSQEFAQDQALPFTLIKSKLSETDFPNNIEAVTLFEVLEHLPNPRTYLSELKVKFPDARIFISVPNPNSWTLIAGRTSADYPPNHLTRWTKRSLEKILEIVGYEEVEVHDDPVRLHDFKVVSLKWFIHTLFEKYSWRDFTVGKMPIGNLQSDVYVSEKENRFILRRVTRGLTRFFVFLICRLLRKKTVSLLVTAKPSKR